MFITLGGMDERRSALEWMFEISAAIGLVVALVSLLFRERYPALDLEALAYAAVGLGLLCGGAAGSRWRRRKRLSALVKAHERSNANAN